MTPPLATATPDNTNEPWRKNLRHELDTELTGPRSALPPLGEDEYYHADLIGLPVVSESGQPLGKVQAVENFGAGDVLDIVRDDGKSFMVPVIAGEIDDSRVVIDPVWAE